MDTTDPILSFSHCTKAYPGVVALRDASLHISPGEIHALVGENGAGKSTLIKCLSGAVELDSGEILFNGQPYQRMTPYLSHSLGIEVIYQELNLVGALTVAENVCFGERYGRLVNYRLLRQKARDVFASMEVHIDVDAMVSTLSIAQQQLVEIAKSISKKAKLLVMDEPTAPLTADETDILFKIMRRLRAEGVTIIYISHRMDEIFTVCDRVTVMRDGEIIDTRNVADTNRSQIISLMVGRTLSESYPSRATITNERMLELRNVTGNGDRGISLHVNKGEIVGLAGLVGSGRTELLRMIYGANRMDSGTLLVKGREVKIHQPAEAIRNGVGLIPENRKEEGCFLYFPVDWNLTIASIQKLSQGLFMNFSRMAQTAASYIKTLRIKTPSSAQMCANLSGGNQQKVVLGKTLATDCDVILFDEPTRGIDVGAKQEIYQLMTRLADDGKAILMATSDMEELLGMSDRMYVIAEGELVGELRKDEATQIRLIHMMSKETEGSNDDEP